MKEAAQVLEVGDQQKGLGMRGKETCGKSKIAIRFLDLGSLGAGYPQYETRKKRKKKGNSLSDARAN